MTTPGAVQKHKPERAEGVVPLEIPEGDDELLRAVVGHYAARLWARPDAEAIVSAVGASIELSRRLSLGICDRSLGLRLPDRQWRAGRQVRDRLTAMGVLRSSGHEELLGCLVVPVTGPAGTVVGLYGRVLHGTTERFVAGLPGGLFNGGDADSGPVLVTGSIPEALAVMSAGSEHAVAPGRPGGYRRAELEHLGRLHGEIVVSTTLPLATAETLGSHGAAVSVLAAGTDLASALASATDPAAALAAMVHQARALAAAAPPNGAESPGDVETTEEVQPAPAAPSLPHDDERDADVYYHHTAARSWRVRGAKAAAETAGQALKVALSVSDVSTGRMHLDVVDLYAARQRAGFVDAAASELHADAEALRVELAQVIAAAEHLRDEAGRTAPGPVALSDTDAEEAMAMLRSPDLLECVLGALRAQGVVGEETNLALCYLATLSRLCERPFGVVVQSSSAAGKSTLADAVCALVPEEDLVSVSALTGQALYYLGPKALARKVLYVAEETGAARAAYALKLLLSEGRLSIAATGKERASGRLFARSYEAAGPVALVLTTTAAEIDPELENRLVVLGVCEDAAQTSAVVAAQRASASLEGLRRRRRAETTRTLQRNAQRLLRPYPVVIEDFATAFPTHATRHRRDHQKLVSVISALAVLHQHQRTKRTVDIDGLSVSYLEADPSDVELATQLLSEVLANDTDGLSPQARRLLEVAKAEADRRAEAAGMPSSEVELTRRELRELLGWSERQVRTTTEALVTHEDLLCCGGGRGRLRSYRLVEDFGPIDQGFAALRRPERRTSHPHGAGDIPKFAGVGPLRRHRCRKARRRSRRLLRSRRSPGVVVSALGEAVRDHLDWLETHGYALSTLRMRGTTSVGSCVSSTSGASTTRPPSPRRTSSATSASSSSTERPTASRSAFGPRPSGSFP